MHKKKNFESIKSEWLKSEIPNSLKITVNHFSV